jgi:hypothetical protein
MGTYKRLKSLSQYALFIFHAVIEKSFQHLEPIRITRSIAAGCKV